jgi:hypothetical protein
MVLEDADVDVRVRVKILDSNIWILEKGDEHIVLPLKILNRIVPILDGGALVIARLPKGLDLHPKLIVFPLKSKHFV